MTDTPTPNTEIVPTDDELMALPPPTEDVVVLARDPAEMQNAQRGLVAWAESKLATVQAELKEAETNLAQSKKLKIRTAGWVRMVTSAKKRVIYYEKLLAALNEGYYIIPNFPMDVIAVRTKAKRPPWGSYHGTPVPDVRPDSAKLGTGRYVDPHPVSDHKWDHENQQTIARPRAFREELDFPFHLVKPKILSDFSEALKLGIFDEIGVFPSPNPRFNQPQPQVAAASNKDPMVIGTIVRRHGGFTKRVSFLISWWIDTRDL